MDCPVCKIPMMVIELEGVEVDHCTSCSGIWLDAGELEELLHSAKKKDQLLASMKVVKTVEKRRRCPICRSRMAKVLAGEGEEPVLIDSCKSQHGLWFDEGELHEVMEHGAGGEQNKILELLHEMFKYDLEKRDNQKS